MSMFELLAEKLREEKRRARLELEKEVETLKQKREERKRVEETLLLPLPLNVENIAVECPYCGHKSITNWIHLRDNLHCCSNCGAIETLENLRTPFKTKEKDLAYFEIIKRIEGVYFVYAVIIAFSIYFFFTTPSTMIKLGMLMVIAIAIFTAWLEKQFKEWYPSLYP